MNPNKGGERTFIILFLSLIVIAVLFLGGYYVYQKMTTENPSDDEIEETEDDDQNTTDEEETESEDEEELNGDESLYELVKGNENLEIISAMIEDSEFADTLKNEDKRFTLFLPRDDAFAAALIPNDPEAINTLLQGYTVEGVYFANDLLEMRNGTLKNLNGDDLTIELGNGKFLINGSEVLIVDLEGNNGVVFIVDQVF